MSSALELCPRVRPDIKMMRHAAHGSVTYIIKEPNEGKYHSIGEFEAALMELMNGRRTPAEIADLAEETLGVRWSAGTIADFAQMLKRMNVVERTPAEDRLMLMERLRQDRKLRSRRRTQGTLLRMRFSVGNPDKLFTRIVNFLPWVWSRPFVLASIGLFAVYTLILILHWDQFWEGVTNLYLLTGFTAWDFAQLYGLTLVVGVIHEFGHGLTTKAHGGEVREIGGMLLYFQPALFCNTTDSYMFEKQSHRLWVVFAGAWVELLIASVGAIIWLMTEPGTLVNKLSFFAFLSAGILAVFTNLNPLIPLDGYYALSDILRLPNLREGSFGYWAWLAKRGLMGMDVAEPAATPRERRIYLIYGGIAIAYSVFFMIVGLVWLIAVVGRLIGPIVWLIVGLMVFKKLKKLASRSQALAQAAATTWRAGFLRGGRAGVLIAVFVALIILPFILPWTTRARGDFRIEASPRAHVRAQVDGVLDRWEVREGETVNAGQPVAVLWNSELESTYLEMNSRAKKLRLDRAAAEARGDLPKAASLGTVLREVEGELGVLTAQRERLVIRSPIDGIVIGHRLAERLGQRLSEGDALVEVATSTGRYARIRVPLRKAGELEPGLHASLKLHARPNLKFISTVSVVAPAAEDGWLEAEVPVPSNGWQPDPGMTGIAKIATRRGTIAQAIARAIRQTFKVDLLL